LSLLHTSADVVVGLCALSLSDVAWCSKARYTCLVDSEISRMILRGADIRIIANLPNPNPFFVSREPLVVGDEPVLISTITPLIH